MDKDRRALVQRLFAMATELLEDAHETAVRGQSHKASPKQLALCAQDLDQTAQALATFATTLTFTLKGDRGRRLRPRKHPKPR